MPLWSVRFLEWTFTMKPRWVALYMMLSLNKTLHITTKLIKIVMAIVYHSHVVRKRYLVCHQCITVKAHYTLHAPLALNPWIFNSELLMVFEPMTPLTRLSGDPKSADKQPTVGWQSSNSRLTNDWRSVNSWPTVIWGELLLTIILFSLRKLTLLISSSGC